MGGGRYAEEVGKSVGSVKKCSYNHDDDNDDDDKRGCGGGGQSGYELGVKLIQRTGKPTNSMGAVNRTLESLDEEIWMGGWVGGWMNGGKYSQRNEPRSYLLGAVVMKGVIEVFQGSAVEGFGKRWLGEASGRMQPSYHSNR